MEKTLFDIETEIIDTFAAIAGSMGYSEVHGKILAALMVSGDELSLEELSKKTRYSSSMISLSLDLLEVIGMIKRVKKANDRKLYVMIDGDLVESIKTAIMIKIGRGFSDVSRNLNRYKTEIEKTNHKTAEKKKLLKSLKKLENETKRIDNYIEKLTKVKIPR